MSKFKTIFQQYQEAVKRLEEVLNQEKNDFIRDSAIQRFEFVFDLSWKTIKAFLEEEKGIVCRSPKGCFKEAYQQELIEYDEFWLELTDYRNRTAHVYNEKMAEEIYEIIPKSLTYFQKLLQSLKE